MLKLVQYQKMSLRSLSGTDAFVIFNLSSGTIQAIGSNAITGTMTDAGGGWYRCTVTYSASQSNVYIYMNDMSTPASGTIYIQDAQLEAGDIATDYIPTTTAVSVGPVANLPRIDYTGGGCGKLLLEPQRTNLVTYSEQFDNADWTKTNSTITANNTASPDGYTNADKLVESSDVSTTAHQIRSSTSPIVTNQVYTYSIFAKGSGRGIQLRAGRSDASAFATVNVDYDLTLGVVDSFFQQNAEYVGSSIEDYGNGWYRCILQMKFTDPTNTNMRMQVYTYDESTNSVSYIGDGTSGAYIWGAQVEAGAYATSYIGPTLGSASTRGADACSKTGISSLIGQTEGTMFFEISALDLDSSNWRTIGVSDGTTNNMINLYFTGRGIANEMRALVRAGAVNYFSEYYVGATITNTIKVAIAYASNDAAFYVNGVQVATGSSVTVPACSALLTKEGSGAAPMLGNLNQALLFKTRLSNSELAQLTTI
jgi:hypothetical protein